MYKNAKNKTAVFGSARRLRKAFLGWLVLCLFVYPSSSAFASPTYVEHHVPDVHTGSGPFTDSITLTCGTDLYLLIALHHDTPIEASSVSYNAVPLSLLLHDESSGGFSTEVWGMVGPDCGSAHDLVITMPSSGDTRVYAITYENVLQVDPVDDTDIQYRNSGSADVVTAITTTEDDEVIFTFVQGNGTVSDDNATTNYTDTRPANLRLRLDELDAPTAGSYSTTYNDTLNFEFTTLSISLMQVATIPPPEPHATVTVATTSLEFISQIGFKVLLLFWLAFIIALWTSRLFWPL